MGKGQWARSTSSSSWSAMARAASMAGRMVSAQYRALSFTASGTAATALSSASVRSIRALVLSVMVRTRAISASAETPMELFTAAPWATWVE